MDGRSLVFIMNTKVRKINDLQWLSVRVPAFIMDAERGPRARQRIALVRSHKRALPVWEAGVMKKGLLCCTYKVFPAKGGAA